MVNKEEMISGEIAIERPVCEIKMTRNFFLEIRMTNTRRVENGNEVHEKEKGERGQELL